MVVDVGVPGSGDVGVARPRFRWAIVGQLWLHQILALVATSGLGVLLIAMEHDLQFGTTGAGWLGSARTVGQFLVFPASFLMVRAAAKRSYSLLLVLMSLAMLLSTFAGTYALLLVGQVLFSLGLALSQVPAALLRMQWVEPGEMARVWGIGNALSAISQSAALALIPFALVMLGGWRQIFAVMTGALVLAWVGWQLTARERAVASGDHAVQRRRADFGALKRSEFYLLGLTTMGGGTAYTAAIIFLPLYFVHDRGMSLAAAGSITAVLPAAGLLSNLSAGFLSDRMGVRKLFIWPAGLVLPFLYFAALSPLPVPIEIGVVFAVGYFAWFPFPILMAMPYELPGIRGEDVAVGQALVQAVSGMGIVVGPIVASYIANATGSYGDGILALSVLPVLFTVGSVFLPETGSRARARAQAAAAEVAGP